MVLFSMATSCLFVCYVDVVVDIEPLWELARVLEVFEYLSGRIFMLAFRWESIFDLKSTLVS